MYWHLFVLISVVLFILTLIIIRCKETLVLLVKSKLKPESAPLPVVGAIVNEPDAVLNVLETVSSQVPKDSPLISKDTEDADILNAETIALSRIELNNAKKVI